MPHKIYQVSMCPDRYSKRRNPRRYQNLTFLANLVTLCLSVKRKGQFIITGNLVSSVFECMFLIHTSWSGNNVAFDCTKVQSQILKSKLLPSGFSEFKVIRWKRHVFRKRSYLSNTSM